MKVRQPTENPARPDIIGVGRCGPTNLITTQEYISRKEFKDLYEQARQTRAAVCGFITYLKKPARRLAGGYEERKETNREP